jgi:hypothetical protein
VFEYHYLRKLADGRRMITVQGGAGSSGATTASRSWPISYGRGGSPMLTAGGLSADDACGARGSALARTSAAHVEFFAPGGERAATVSTPPASLR